VSQKLQGSLDYYLRTPTQLLVIEAKQADLTRGLTQLTIELIALEQWTELTQPDLLGAVTERQYLAIRGAAPRVQAGRTGLKSLSSHGGYRNLTA